MFWSMKSSTVLMSAGKNAAQRAQTGRVMKGTSHGRPTVVVNAVGTTRVGRVRAYLKMLRWARECETKEGERGVRGGQR